jgi:hypothetical protein
MRTFAQKPEATQRTKSAKSTIPGRARFGQSPEVDSNLRLQRTIGNQAVLRMLQAQPQGLEVGYGTTATVRFAHDFSRIPIHPPAAGIQTKLAINKPGDIYEQEADQVSEQIMRMPDPELQLACPCGGGCPKCQTEQVGQGRERLHTKRIGSSNLEQTPAPPIVHEASRSPGQPLDAVTRAFIEPHFGYDFSRVRVHTDGEAGKSARAVSARAYTLGHSIVFGEGQYSPATRSGNLLLAHELAHVVQQDAAVEPDAATYLEDSNILDTQRGEFEADKAVADLEVGLNAGEMQTAQGVGTLQRQTHGAPRPQVRSPVFEELVTQVSTVEAEIHGRPLTHDERVMAQSVFGASIDYSRVRLIPTSILEYRTVANTIRVPKDYTINDSYMAQTLIHELAHVWQYQHGGTSYISVSLATQISAAMRGGNRSLAYDYRVTAGASFFDFTPEQQGMLVENYFTMLRDQVAIPRDLAAGIQSQYISNHMDSSGNWVWISAQDRQAEITSELPLHRPLIQQMRAGLPRPEVDLLNSRAMEIMTSPGETMFPVPEERRLTPVKPLLEVRFR